MTDIRFALRAFRRNPGYVTVAVLTLTLAVGGATAIFSVLNAVVLRPLPYPDSAQLVVIRDSMPPKLPFFSLSPARFLAWQVRTHDFQSIAATGSATLNLTGEGDPRRLVAARASANLFPMLGVAPRKGRTFTSEEDAPGGSQVIVLSEGLWRGAFGGRDDIIGRTILIDDKPRQVVGIMPAAFAFPGVTTQAWVPLALDNEERTLYGSHYLACFGRLKPGVTVEHARADLVDAARQIEPLSPSNKGWTALTDRLQDYVVRNVKTGLWVLSGGVGLLLLIACANIANLLLARGVSRQRELGVRSALGASRGRLVRQLVTENLVLGVAGSVLGVVLAWGILQAVAESPSTNLPRAQSIAMDLPMLVFALTLAALTPLVFGLIPAIQVSRTDLRELVAQGGRSGSSTLRARTRAALVVAEVALAVMLVAGAMLLVRSFARLMDVSPGFETERQLVIGLSLPDARYATNDRREAFWLALIERVRRMPGVESAAVTQALPLMGDHVGTLEIPDKTPAEPSARPSTNFYAISPDYFRTMGIPLIRGRGIEASDGPKTPRVAVISRLIADRYFPNENPIGHRLRVSQGPGDAMAEIVGVAGDVKQYGLDSATTLQVYEPARYHNYFSAMQLIVRSAASPDTLTASVRGVVKDLDSSLPIATARTLSSVVASSIGPRRFTMTLLAAFAGVALLLAAIGVYGVMTFLVGQRTQEIGIRMALGARPGGVLRIVLTQALWLTAAGGAIGVVGALWATRLLQTELFEVSARDPVAFVAAPLLLIAIAAVAVWWPARRALKVDPVTALRAG